MLVRCFLAVTLAPLITVFSQESPGSRSFEQLPLFEVQTAATGPWGQLEYFRFLLEPPDSYISRSDDLLDWNRGTLWSVEADSIEEVHSFLLNAGLSEETATALVAPESMQKNSQTGWYDIRPWDELILSLTPAQRSALYPNLRPHEPINPYFQPFALSPGGIYDVALLPHGLESETIDLIERLSYPIGDARRFSDIRYLFGKSSSDAERRRILKTLGRESSLSTRLVISSETDISSLEEYWSAGGRNREILPIMESISASPGVDRLDVTHLLPPTPRMLIHTFPSEKGYGIAGDMPDCFWTAFSFFTDDPPERHLDYTEHVFLERYEPATPPFRFGDLILIVDPAKDDWLHACNYLAENLVYTKNGKSMGRPWVISTLNRVVKSYLKVDEVKVTFHRLKPEYDR